MLDFLGGGGCDCVLVFVNHAQRTWLNPLYQAPRCKAFHAMCMHVKPFTWRPDLAYSYLTFPLFPEKCKLTFLPFTNYWYYEWQECSASITHNIFHCYGHTLLFRELHLVNQLCLDLTNWLLSCNITAILTEFINFRHLNSVSRIGLAFWSGATRTLEYLSTLRRLLSVLSKNELKSRIENACGKIMDQISSSYFWGHSTRMLDSVTCSYCICGVEGKFVKDY